MGVEFVVVIAAFGVVCLAPLSVYLGWLSLVNARGRPTVVAGPWDAVGLLAGLAGFVLFAGTLAVTTVQANGRSAVRGDFQQVRDGWGQGGWGAGATAAGFALLVGGAAAAAVLARSGSLSVYNIDRRPAEAAVDQTLADLGFAAHRHGDVWADGRELVRLDHFPGLRHATVRPLLADPRVREELDRGLRARLAVAPGADLPVGSWFLSAALSCVLFFGSCLFLLGFAGYNLR